MKFIPGTAERMHVRVMGLPKYKHNDITDGIEEWCDHLDWLCRSSDHSDTRWYSYVEVIWVTADKDFEVTSNDGAGDYGFA